MSVLQQHAAKAMAYGVYDIRRIDRMLKNGVEADLPKNDDELTLFEESPRFARDGTYFKNYS